MLTMTLREDKTNKVLKTLYLPEKAEEVLYAERIELDAHATRIKHYISSKIKERNKKAKKKRVDAKTLPLEFSFSKYLKMVKYGLISYFDGKLSKEEIEMLPSGEYRQSVFNIGKGKNSKPTFTLIGLWDYLQWVCLTYRPKIYDKGQDHTFVHNDKEYIIHSFIVNKILQKTSGPTMSVQEVIESLDIEDYYNRKMKAIKPEEQYGEKGKKKKGFLANAELEYIKNLKKISILSRRKGERLPLDDNDFDKWVDNRFVELQTINQVDALDSLFFLSGTLKT